MLTTRQKIALARSVQAPLLALRRVAGLGLNAACDAAASTGSSTCARIDFSIYLLGAFEPATVAAYERHVDEGMTVLDIGANVGAHTLHLARLVGPDGRVLAFEPTRWAVDKLQANIALNPQLAAPISVFQVMLVGRDDVEVPDELPSSWPIEAGDDVHPLLRARSMPTEGAKAGTLDSIVEEAGLARVDFIKMDVDGYECQVLEGMGRTLREFRPLMLMEFSPYGLAEKGGSLARMVGLLRAAGYRFLRLDGTTPLPADVESLHALVGAGAGFNVIAKPVVT